MSKKYNYRKAEERYKNLQAKRNNATEEEAIERAELKCLLAKHAAALELEQFKKQLAEAKDQALLRIIKANRIETENELKAVFRYVTEHAPEILPPKGKK